MIVMMLAMGIKVVFHHLFYLWAWITMGQHLMWRYTKTNKELKQIVFQWTVIATIGLVKSHVEGITLSWLVDKNARIPCIGAPNGNRKSSSANGFQIRKA